MSDKERKRWVIYYDETMLSDMQLLKGETAKKDGVPVEDITVRRVVADTTREKAIEYKDRQNNRARITDIVNALKVLPDIVSELKALRAEVNALKGGSHDEPATK